MKEFENIEKSREQFLKSTMLVMIFTGSFYSVFWYFLNQHTIAKICFSTGVFGVLLLFYKKLKIPTLVISYFVLTIGNLFLLIINVFFLHILPVLLIYFVVVPIASLILIGRKYSPIWLIIAVFTIGLSVYLNRFYHIDIIQSSQRIAIVNMFQSLTIFLIYTPSFDSLICLV